MKNVENVWKSFIQKRVVQMSFSGTPAVSAKKKMCKKKDKRMPKKYPKAWHKLKHILGETAKTHPLVSSWWFQPIWKIFVNLEYFPKIGIKTKKIFELPPPSFLLRGTLASSNHSRPNTKLYHFGRAAKAFAVVQSCEGNRRSTSYESPSLRAWGII